MMGTDETLNDDEALLFVRRDCSYNQSTISFEHGKTYSIKKQLKEFVLDSNAMANTSATFVLIVPDVHAAVDTLVALGNKVHVYFYWRYAFDTDLSQEDQISLTNDLYAALSDTYEKNEAVYTSLRSYSIESRAANYEYFFADFAGLFYLAIILSIVFLLAAVLIIYYKQISEGYEDQSRFEIMQKVGMTKREIRKSINSQLLTVFFLPLAGAGLHLIFAFPMISQILSLFNLTNLELFTIVTLICFALFALFYTIVYRITSNAYYRIVSGAREEA